MAGPREIELIERLARHILHDDVAFVASLAHLVDGADIGMLNRRGETRFAQHRRAHLLRREQTGTQNLEYHGTLQQRVVRKIHNTAAACAEPANNLVVLDGLAFHRCFQCSCSVVRTVSDCR